MFSGKIKASDEATSTVKGKEIKVGRLGAIIGDGAELKNVTIQAGVKIWPGKEIRDKELQEDVQ